MDLHCTVKQADAEDCKLDHGREYFHKHVWKSVPVSNTFHCVVCQPAAGIVTVRVA